MKNTTCIWLKHEGIANQIFWKDFISIGVDNSIAFVSLSCKRWNRNDAKYLRHQTDKTRERRLFHMNCWTIDYWLSSMTKVPEKTPHSITTMNRTHSAAFNNQQMNTTPLMLLFSFRFEIMSCVLLSLISL